MSTEMSRSRVSPQVPNSRREQRDANAYLSEGSVEVLPHTPHTLRMREESRQNISAGKCEQDARQFPLGQLLPPGTDMGLAKDLAMSKAVQLGRFSMKRGNKEVQHQNDSPAGEQSSGTIDGCPRGQSNCRICKCSYVSQSVTYDGVCESCTNLESPDDRGEWKGDVSDDGDDEELLPLGDGPEICVLNRCYSPTLEDYSYFPLSFPLPENMDVNCEDEPQRTELPADTNEPEQVHEQHVIARPAAFPVPHIPNAPNWDKVSSQEGQAPNDGSQTGVGFEGVSNPEDLAQTIEKTRLPLPTSGKEAVCDVVPMRSKINTRSTSSSERVTTKFDQARNPETAASSNSKFNTWTVRKKRTVKILTATGWIGHSKSMRDL